MKVVSKRIKSAFQACRPLSVGNTRTDGAAVYLFGNKIIERRSDGVYWTLAGWPTVTTRERVNAIAGAGVYPKGGVQMAGDKPVDAYDWYKAQA